MSPVSPVSVIQSVLSTIIVVRTLIRNVEEEEVEMELVLGNVGKIIITYLNEPFIVKLYYTSTL